MVRAARAFLLICVSLGLGACDDARLVFARTDVSASAEAVDFGRVWVGRPASRSIEVQNRSRAAITAELTTTGGFLVSGDARLTLGAGETRAVDVTLTADHPGAHQGVLALTGDGLELLVALSAAAGVPSSCVAGTPCSASVFDEARGLCVLSALPDGTTCDPAGACALGPGMCAGGACVAAAKSCDDRNPCTSDACAPDSGCVHIDQSASCAAPADPCKVSFCHPLTGCGIADAADGTSCGVSDCVVSNVCLSGVCTTTATPEGASCGAPSPFQAPGTCHAQVCERPAPTGLVEQWRYSLASPGYVSWSGAEDQAGNIYFTEVTQQAPDEVWLVSLDVDGQERYRVGWTTDGWVSSVIVDDARGLLYVSEGRYLGARRLSDGSRVWTRDLQTLVIPNNPDARMTTGSAMLEPTLGRVVIMGHEDHTMWDSWLIALDANTGAHAWTKHYVDHLGTPLSDGLGNLYFNHSGAWGGFVDIISVDADGKDRWRRNIGAAPIAAHGGRLYLGGVTDVLDASTGATLHVLAQSASWSPGALVDDQRLWVGTNGGAELSRLDLKSGQVLSSSLGGKGFLSDTFATSNGGAFADLRAGGSQGGPSHVAAVDEDGNVGFICELNAGATGLLRAGSYVRRENAGAPSIVSYALPGIAPSTSGWTCGNGGNPQRTRNPR